MSKMDRGQNDLRKGQLLNATADNLHGDTKMKKGPWLWVFAFCVLLILLVILIIFGTKKQNSAVLLAANNKFKIDFTVLGEDSLNFSKILEKLGLSAKTTSGVEFELDATTSAQLAYLSPIETKFKVLGKQVSFAGQMSHTLNLREFVSKGVRIPKSFNLAAVAFDFRDLLKAKFEMSAEVESWIDSNLSSGEQYLVIFGENSDWAIIFRENNLDFSALMKIKSEEEPVYKEELQDDVNIHLIKLAPLNNETERTLAIFQIGDLGFLTSSRQAASELIAVQKSQRESIYFPEESGKVSALILMRSPKDSQNLAKLAEFFVSGGDQVFNLFKNLDEFKFVLAADRFSGLISVK